MSHIVSREVKELAREIEAHAAASFKAGHWIDRKAIGRSIQRLVTVERNRAFREAARVCLGMVRKASRRKLLKPLPTGYRRMP